MRCLTTVRAVNDQARRVAQITGRQGNFDVLCECGADECDQVVRVSGRTYGAVRRQPHRLIVARGHEVFVHGVIAREARNHVVMERNPVYEPARARAS